jgi:hypothetical protein
VISQDPPAGADAQAGEVVTIHVGKLAPGNGNGNGNGAAAPTQ